MAEIHLQLVKMLDENISGFFFDGVNLCKDSGKL
jgi:hypothetical protein